MGDKYIKNGFKSSIPLEKNGKISVNVLIGRVWKDANVGVFIDVPLSGTPIVRSITACMGVWAVEKYVQKKYHSHLYGEFNPKLEADGIKEITAIYDVVDDGAPSMLRISYTIKPSKLGDSIGRLLGNLSIKPPTSEIHNPKFDGIVEDVNDMMWGIKNFINTAYSKGKICVIGGKRVSVKNTFISKAEEVFKKQFSAIPSGKETSPTGDAPFKGMTVLAYPSKDPIVSLFLAHGLSNAGPVWYENGKVGTVTDETLIKYHKKHLKSNLTVNRVASMVKYYATEASRDKLSNKSIGTQFAIGAIGLRLPIDLAMQLTTVSGSIKGVKIGESVHAILSK